MQYMAAESDQDSFLWIYARPGAGKTVLSSFLIDYFKSPEASSSKDILYFYCKNTDSDKSTPMAIIRSLLYQLYRMLDQIGRSSSLTEDIESKMNNSGQQRALEFNSVWQIFSTHVLDLTQPTVILDALDECQDPSSLVQKLKSFCDSSKISVIATSRKEGDVYKKADGSLSFKIAPEDIDADVASFIEAKVTKNPKLSRSSVRDLIVRRLRCSHGGMFLYAYLMLKELKSCFSDSQVHDVLHHLPSGLSGLYDSILKRLERTLKPIPFELCRKVLMWVVSAHVSFRSKPLQYGWTDLKTSPEDQRAQRGFSLPLSD